MAQLPDFVVAVDAEKAAQDLNEVAKRLEDTYLAYTRRGPRTTEFWVSIGSVLFAACTLAVDTLSGRTDPVSHAIITAAGLLTVALTALGYSSSRAKAKGNAVAAVMASREVHAPAPAAPLAGG